MTLILALLLCVELACGRSGSTTSRTFTISCGAHSIGIASVRYSWSYPNGESDQTSNLAAACDGKTSCTYFINDDIFHPFSRYYYTYECSPPLFRINDQNIGGFGWQLFEGPGRWYECGNGYVIGGFRHTINCQPLYCLEEMKCIRPNTNNIVDNNNCYEYDIWSAFHNPGFVVCNEGYFVRGIWSDTNNGDCGLHCWHRLRCCKYDESKIRSGLEVSTQDWWSCFDTGSGSDWCVVDNDKYITGFYTSGNQNIDNLEAAKTRQLYLYLNHDRSENGIYIPEMIGDGEKPNPNYIYMVGFIVINIILLIINIGIVIYKNCYQRKK
eukprot:245453_1